MLGVTLEDAVPCMGYGAAALDSVEVAVFHE